MNVRLGGRQYALVTRGAHGDVHLRDATLRDPRSIVACSVRGGGGQRWRDATPADRRRTVCADCLSIACAMDDQLADRVAARRVTPDVRIFGRPDE
jgi:hypothetical protein